MNGSRIILQNGKEEVEMKRFEHKVMDELGLHARPCSVLVKETQKYKSNIMITLGEKQVDAKRLLGVMSLGVKHNDNIILSIDGEDEALAFEELQKFCSINV